MSENLSHRHHYIPQFLIRNFADTDGLLWVYNKKDRTFQKKSPRSIFYEWDRNLFELGGKPSDNIEKVYADVDALLGACLKYVLATQSMKSTEQTLLLFLVSLMN